MQAVAQRQAVRAVHLDDHRKVRAYLGTDGTIDFAPESCAPLEGTTVFVLAPVGVGRKKLAQQVTIRRVHLNAVEACALAAPGGCGKLFDDAVNFRYRHLPRDGASQQILYPGGRNHIHRTDEAGHHLATAMV